MGIQINGNTNNINAGIGSLSIEDLREIDIVGVATASNFKTGSSNLHSTGLTVGNALVHSTGINVGTGATVHCPATNVLTFGTNSNERLRLDSSGRIIQNYAALPSVSSNLPYAYFAPTKQNYGGVDLTMNLHDDASNALGNGGGIGFSANSSSGSPIVRGAIRGNTEATDSTAGYLSFFTRPASGDNTERLRITSTGLVGVNVTPTSHNNTTAFQIHDTYNSQGYPRLRLTNQSTGSTSADGFEIVLDGSNLDAIVRQRENADIHFYTNNTERVRIISSGEVSIGGFAPTAGAGILQINGGLRVAGSGSASDTITPYIYRTSGVDNLNFATSGVERLRIGSNGQVIISNSNPPATGPMMHITDDGSATTLGTAATFRISNDGGSANYSVFEAQSASGYIRLANNGKFFVSNNIRVDISTACDGVLGEAYSGYFGLKHSDQTLNSEYMIISNDTHTYLSSSANGNIYVRPGANNSDHETLFAQNITTFKTHIAFSSGHYLQRSDHHTGHLVGSYNNVGANSQKSNPIYTIGSNYNPGDNDLGNMYGIGYSHGNNASFISFSGLTGWGLYVAADGDCRMFLDASTGKIAATGTISGGASDVRLKTNIKVIDNPIEKIKKIRGVTFDWIDNITTEYDFHPDSMHETGVIAQEIQEVIPDAVTTAPFNGNYTKKSGTDNNFLTVKDEKIIPLCIEAIKELSAQVELLKSKVATLEGS